MKKRSIFALLLAAVMMFAAACQTGEAGGVGGAAVSDDGPFPGKIAIVSSPIDQNEEEFRSAEQVQAKYGKDKVSVVTYPSNFMVETEQVITVVTRAAADPDVKILLINQSVPGMVAAVDKVLESRDDLFIVMCNPQEDAPSVSARANLALNPNTPARGFTYAERAAEAGAETIVHYSFTRHMAQPQNAARRDNMKATAEALGIKFIEASAPDPTGEGGIPGSQQYMYEDIPKMIEEYGKNTAIFATNCSMQTPIINRVMELGAMYVEPCCPSPYHAYPNALGIEIPEGMADVPFVIAETKRIVEEEGQKGRMSNWPVPLSFLYTHVGTAYAIKAVNGEVPYDEIDYDVLSQLIQDYVLETVNMDVEVNLAPYTEPYVLEEGAEPDLELNDFVWILMEHLVY